MESQLVEVSAVAFFKPEQIIRFKYKNWRGATAIRTVRVVALTYGATEWHPEAQWLMEAFDFERNENRLFAVCDMVPLAPE